MSEAGDNLLAGETALSTLRGAPPEIDAVRHELSSWRFFHGFRGDVASPILAADGSNLAAVFATLRHIREGTVDLDAAGRGGFPMRHPLKSQSPTDSPRSASATPKRPSASSRRTNCRTARCNSSPFAARC